MDAYAYSENTDGDWSQVKELTLALVDLSKIGDVTKAFDEMAFNLATQALSDDKLYAEILRRAESGQS